MYLNIMNTVKPVILRQQYVNSCASLANPLLLFENSINYCSLLFGDYLRNSLTFSFSVTLALIFCIPIRYFPLLMEMNNCRRLYDQTEPLASYIV